MSDWSPNPDRPINLIPTQLDRIEMMLKLLLGRLEGQSLQTYPVGPMYHDPSGRKQKEPK